LYASGSTCIDYNSVADRCLPEPWGGSNSKENCKHLQKERLQTTAKLNRKAKTEAYHSLKRTDERHLVYLMHIVVVCLSIVLLYYLWSSAAATGYTATNLYAICM